MESPDYSALLLKVDAELRTHLPPGNKNTAELVILIGRICKNAVQFDHRLKINRAALPVPLVNSLLAEIHRVFPPEHEIEVIVGEDPPFLRGKSDCSGSGNTPPVTKLVKFREGPLSLVARYYSVLLDWRGDLRGSRAPVDPIPEKAVGDIGFADYDMPVWKREAFAAADGFRKSAMEIPIEIRREILPIHRMKSKIIKAVNESLNRVVVLVSEAGSGVTTQLPQYLVESGIAGQGMIGCVQPCREAAVSAARRVAEESGCVVGEKVGYAVRFDACTGPDTVIKFLTDGELLREFVRDRNLSRYSVIILDEAQERTADQDVILGLMKTELLERRPDLRLVIAVTASLESREMTKFSAYFSNCSVVPIRKHSFLFRTLYVDHKEETDYLMSALKKVMEIHRTQYQGDILLFLTGQEEVEYACRNLHNRINEYSGNNTATGAYYELVVLPFYSELPSEFQSAIRKPASPGKRKVVVATDIAESWSTIPGIVYVIDSGLVKRRVYNPKLALDSLRITPISRASADRRADYARCSVHSPGRCYRLYPKTSLSFEIPLSTPPEIHRRNLAGITLRTRVMGISDLSAFEFIDRPSPQALASALRQLYHLGALNNDGVLTRKGRIMAEFPLEPPWSMVLLAGLFFKCSDEVLTIIAMVNAGSIFYRPYGGSTEAEQRRASFFRAEGDHLTLLAVYEAWKAHDFSAQWCLENFVQTESMKKAHDFKNNLFSIVKKFLRIEKLDIVSAGSNSAKIGMAITAGLFFHVARRYPRGGFYVTLVGNKRVYIHRRSALHRIQPSWVVYSDQVIADTDKRECICGVTAIDPTWLLQLAPRLFRVADRTKKTTSQAISEIAKFPEP